jgi:PAS domain S-box-containing protein
MPNSELSRQNANQPGEQPRPADEPACRILDAIPQDIVSGPADGALDFCNFQWRAYTGLTLEEVRGDGWKRMIHPDDFERVAAAWREAVATGTAYEQEERHRRFDGTYRWFLARVVPRRDAAGRVERWFGSSTDIEDRKRAEEALRESERRFKHAQLYARLGYWELDLVADRITATAETDDLFGLPAGTNLSMAEFEALIHPDDRDLHRRALSDLLQRDKGYDLEYRIVRPDGDVRYMHVRDKLVRDESGQPIRMYGIVQDITERKRATEALRRNEELLRRAEAMAHSASWTFAVDDEAVFASDGGQRLFGWAPGPRRLADLLALVHPDDRPQVESGMQAALAGTPFEIEHRLVVAGEVKWVRRRIEPDTDATGRVVRLVGVSQDITAWRRLEEQFRQAQKMEAVGTLAGGVAHDFNNLLTVINGYSDLLLSDLEPGDPMRELLVEIHKAGVQGALLTRQMLMFSRQQVVEPKVLDLNAVIADTEKMLRRLIREDIILTTALAPSLAAVKSDPGQLEQVLMNLSVNARDAMPHGGRLTIETRNVTLDETYNRMHPQVRPGEYVLLAVSDTGTGMDPQTKARVFEPFFTTKGAGKGTGLGLAVVHGVVTQGEGHIEVYSEVGQGTTFKLYLPAVKEQLKSGKSVHGLDPMPRGSETLLLVEDEDAVRALARHVLTACGYTVLEAADGRDAVQVAERHAGSIDLVVSDVVMPHLGGRQLVERLVAVRPGMKVLFLSGYTDYAVVRHGVLEADHAFLQKPFTPTALAQKVRDVLGQKR